MDLQDQTTLDTFMQHVDRPWDDEAPGWIEQTDGDGAYRVLLGKVQDLSFAGKRLRVFRVQMSGHQASPIYYVFGLSASTGACAKTAHYILSHQRSLAWREWFCDVTQRTVPHTGTYRGDLSMVGATFRQISWA